MSEKSDSKNKKRAKKSRGCYYISQQMAPLQICTNKKKGNKKNPFNFNSNKLL